METQHLLQAPLVAINSVAQSPATLARATDNLSLTGGEQTESKTKDSCGKLHAMSTPSWAEPWYTLLVDDKINKDTRGDLFLADGESEEAQDGRLAAVLLSEDERALIPQDVRRTRSGISVFREEPARDWLQRCVALFCRERGLRYAQGLSELAAPWALVTDPPSLNSLSYRCFSRFVDRFAPHMFTAMPDSVCAFYGDAERCSFVVLEAHLALFEALLRYHDPALASFMEECGMTADAYATPWFLTIFARHTQIPVILHLWRRMTESGDPLMHQFLALAWLLSNRRGLMGTPRDDVPEAITKLRLQSTDVVDGVWAAAVALRRSTPRRLSKTLHALCYEAGGWDGKRLESLGTLKATQVAFADADQVAEMVLSFPQGPAEDGGREWGDGAGGGQFVLVDCRSADVLATEKTESSIVGARMEEAITGMGLAGGRVVWRRVDPAAILGMESKAAAEVLRGVVASGTGRFVGEGEVKDFVVADDVRASHAASVGNGDCHGEGKSEENGVTVQRSVTDAAASTGVVSNGIRRLANGLNLDADATPFTAATNTADELPVTYVCFIGSGGESEPRNGDGVRMLDPAARLARAAARAGLARVCVLQGGFSSFEKALARRARGVDDRIVETRMAMTPRDTSTSADKLPLAVAISTLSADVTKTTVSETTASMTHAPSQAAPPNAGGGASAAAPLTAATHADTVAPTTTTGSSTPKSAAAIPPPPRTPKGATANSKCRSRAFSLSAPAAGPASTPGTPRSIKSLPEATRTGGGGGGAAAPGRSILLERATGGKVVSNSSKIREPFRAYAKKSADEMGRALRSLPAAAGKHLEDAARVCTSLARCNVKVLGESRVALTRSVSRIEQLDARMSGTMRAFARHFGGPAP